MNRIGVRSGLVFLVLAAAGCGRDTFESLRKQQVETANEAVHALVDVRDAESAVKAKPKLKQLGERWRDLEKRVDALPAVSKEEEERAKPLTAELDKLVLRYVGEAIRVNFVPGGKEALAEIGEVKKKK